MDQHNAPDCPDRPVAGSRTAPPGEFRDPKRAKRLEAVRADAPSKLPLFRRVYAGKSSPRECIKAFCLECLSMDEAAIRDCTATACPLFDLRPYQGPQAR